jgi:hypothetical protein
LVEEDVDVVDSCLVRCRFDVAFEFENVTVFSSSCGARSTACVDESLLSSSTVTITAASSPPPTLPPPPPVYTPCMQMVLGAEVSMLRPDCLSTPREYARVDIVSLSNVKFIAHTTRMIPNSLQNLHHSEGGRSRKEEEKEPHRFSHHTQ